MLLRASDTCLVVPAPSVQVAVAIATTFAFVVGCERAVTAITLRPRKCSVTVPTMCAVGQAPEPSARLLTGDAPASRPLRRFRDGLGSGPGLEGEVVPLGHSHQPRDQLRAELGWLEDLGMVEQTEDPGPKRQELGHG